MTTPAATVLQSTPVTSVNSSGGSSLTSGGMKPTTATENTLASWYAPYATDLLNRQAALSNMEFTPYTGQLTAGPSELQTQAFQGIGNLTLPTALTTAANQAQDVYARAGQLSYTPTTVTNAYTAPTAYTPITATNQYTGTAPYTTANIQSTYNAAAGNYKPVDVTNQYTATGPYEAANIQNTYESAGGNYTPTDITTGTFDQAAAQKYMNPYLQSALAPQLAEAQRQAQILQMQNASKLAQAGAYGGSRQAIMDAETQRNLMTNLANITGQGYNTAFNAAQAQFNAEQAKQMEAQKANVQQAQYAAQLGMTDAQLKAQYGMTAAQANEASRQFAAQQALTNAQNTANYGQQAQAERVQQAQYAAQLGMTDAQLMAQYGMTAAQANEASRQFGASQALANAQNAANYGQQAQAANIQQAQFAATQAANQAAQEAQYDLAAQQANQAANQFAANYGLQGLSAQQAATNALAGIGGQEAQYGLANLNAQLAAGKQQQDITQAGLSADYAQYLRQFNYPQEQLTNYMNALKAMPAYATTAQNVYGQTPGILQNIAGGAQGVLAIAQQLKSLGMTPTAIADFFKSNGIDYGATGDLSASDVAFDPTATYTGLTYDPTSAATSWID